MSTTTPAVNPKVKDEEMKDAPQESEKLLIAGLIFAQLQIGFSQFAKSRSQEEYFFIRKECNYKGNKTCFPSSERSFQSQKKIDA